MSESNPMASFNGLSRNDQIFLGAGLLTFIFSFIDFAHIKVSGLGSLGGGIGGTSITAWHGIGTLAGLLILVALVVGALSLFAPSSMPQLPVSPRMIGVGLAVLALLFFIIRWLTLPSDSFGPVHAGFSLAWGGYVTLILNIVMIAGGFLGLKAAGESMPWENRGGATPPPVPPAV
jgi:hypothetical protein